MMSLLQTIWLLACAALVFLTQMGFMMTEAGFTRVKSIGSVFVANLSRYVICVLAFLSVGFGIMHGRGGFAGGLDLFLAYGPEAYPSLSGVPFAAFVIFSAALCATPANIVSGAMAGRAKFAACCVYGLAVSVVLYPVAGHWIWGGGWLAQMGFHDFAGGTVIHVLGGTAALVGSRMLGPRLGKFSRQGKSNAIPVQNVTLCVLGVFALWLGWFGFFGAAGLSDEKSIPALIAKTVLNLNLSVAASVTVAVILTSIRYKKPDVTIIFNAVTAGLVAVSAGCDTVGPTGAIIIGALAGVAVGFSIEMVDKAFKVDDPVGAVSTHGVCGLLGTVLVGFFTENGGMLYTGRWDAVGTQMLGAAAVALWSAALMSLVFLAVRATMGMRVSHRAEVEGIDAADFALYTPAGQVMSMSLDDYADYADEPIPVEAAVPVKSRLSGHTTGKLTMVQIIMKQARFEALKEALNDIGVTGMTVSHVLGCGMQKGETEYHRGVPLDIKLLPKIKIELVVAKIPVEDVIRTARRVLYTGHIGDGKIFVLDVQNAVKVRTGEDGYDALQGVDE